MEKAPAELVERFKAVMARFPEVQQRKMFGYPCAFTNDHMVTGLHGSSWMIRLPEAAREELLDQDGAGPFEPMAGRPMREYVVLPAATVDDDAAMVPWIERSLAYVATLPPKPPKVSKAARAAKVGPSVASPATKGGR